MIGLLWLAILLAPAILLGRYFAGLWSVEQYQYFPVLILAVGSLFYARWDKNLAAPETRLSISLAVFAVLLYIVAVVAWSPWLACVGLVCGIGALFSAQQGETPSRWGMLYLWPATWLLLRLPMNLDMQLTTWLRSVTSRFSSDVLHYLELPHRLTGNVFQLPRGALFVEDACSGVQSVFALLFCAVLLLVWLRRSLWLAPIYVGFAILWAAVMNILRIVCIAIGQEWYGVDLAHGWRHELLGYICLALAIALLASIDRFLKVVFFPVPESEDSKQNPVANAWNWLFAAMSGVEPQPMARKTASPFSMHRLAIFGGPVVAVLLLVGQLAVAASLRSRGDQTTQEQASITLDPNLFTGLANTTFGEPTEYVDGENPALGQHATVWPCQIAGVPSMLVVSQHTEFHDLCNCYQATGWELLERDVAKSTLDAGQDWELVVADFRNSEFSYGHLLFSTMDSAANPLSPSDASFRSLLAGRTGVLAALAATTEVKETVNIQLWTASGVQISLEQRQQLKDAFLQMRRAVNDAVGGSR